MSIPINAKDLRALLPELVKRVRRGDRFTVIYRSRPAFQIVPVDESEAEDASAATDSLYQAPAVGRSRDGHAAADHDEVIYRR